MFCCFVFGNILRMVVLPRGRTTWKFVFCCSNFFLFVFSLLLTAAQHDCWFCSISSDVPLSLPTVIYLFLLLALRFTFCACCCPRVFFAKITVTGIQQRCKHFVLRVFVFSSCFSCQMSEQGGFEPCGMAGSHASGNTTDESFP